MSKLKTSLLLFILPLCIFYSMEFFICNPFEKERLPIQLMNILFFQLFTLFGLFLFKKAKVILWLECLIFGCFGLINYFLISFRSIPFMPWDIFSMMTAASVADNYRYTLDAKAILLLLVFIGIFILSFFIDITVTNLKLRLSGGLISFLCLTSFILYVQSPAAVSQLRLYDKLFTPAVMTYRNGTMITLFMQMQYLDVKEPKGYSKEKAAEILSAYDAYESSSLSADDELPSIIVIMNEAFSDLSLLGEFQTNKDPIPFVSSLLSGQENTQSGTLYVSVLGGNTANSEFEFLTSHSMAFLPQGSIPYQQYTKEATSSLASYLKDFGYKTTAIHPYYASGWHRDQVYPLLGFDSFISLEDFVNPELIRKYVSDREQYQKIIELLENNHDRSPLFLFNVTMQNHSSYTENFDNFSPSVTLTSHHNDALSNYLSLLHESDRDLQEFIAYLSSSSEKIILLFFGDHQPADSVVSGIWKENGKDPYSLSLEDQRKRYQVPFFLWANFPLEEKTEKETSLNYLALDLLEAAGLPFDQYYRFLHEQYISYPVISAIEVKDSKGNSFDPDDRKDHLSSYHILQYNRMFP